jgi:hypothetical protein
MVWFPQTPLEEPITMKKRDFLKTAGVGTATAVAATAVNVPTSSPSQKTPIKFFQT